jgi:hypothetical protein
MYCGYACLAYLLTLARLFAEKIMLLYAEDQVFFTRPSRRLTSTLPIRRVPVRTLTPSALTNLMDMA